MLLRKSSLLWRCASAARALSTSAQHIKGALSHIRVLDLSRVLAGPWATQIYADMGADVIKIERPGEGDDTRRWGPPFFPTQTPTSISKGESAYFCSTNRGKRSVAIDFTKPAGRDLVYQLAKQSDVLVENYKVGSLGKYGLDYETIHRTVNPRLVYCSITGFGQTGPRAYQAGYDFICQGMGGLMHITGLPDNPPMKVGVAVVDILTGMYAAVGVLAALAHRDQPGHGKGQHIDIALLDTQIAMLANQGMNFLATGRSPTRLGNSHPNIAPYDTLKASDGYFIVAIGNDAQFATLCSIFGGDAASLPNDPRFQSNANRVKNRTALLAALEAASRNKTRAEWISKLEVAGVPCGVVNDVKEAFEEPQVQARKMQVEMQHPACGTMPLIGSPLKMSETPVQYTRPPPMLGEHTDEVLCGLLGLGMDDVAGLRKEGVVA